MVSTIMMEHPGVKGYFEPEQLVQTSENIFKLVRMEMHLFLSKDFSYIIIYEIDPYKCGYERV